MSLYGKMIEKSYDSESELSSRSDVEEDNSVVSHQSEHDNQEPKTPRARLFKLTPTHANDFIFGALDVHSCGLTSLQDSCPHRLLHLLNASNNLLQDMSAVGELKELVSLNLSYNRLKEVFHFPPLLWLQEVDLSHNMIEKLPDLGSFLLLSIIKLDDNQITSLEGLRRCRHLRHVSACRNQLASCQGLHQLPLTRLQLSGNQLSSTVSLGRLVCLRQLQLDCNYISQLDGLDLLPRLRYLSCRRNRPLANIVELRHLGDLPQLIALDLRGCPIRKCHYYQVAVLLHGRHLQKLDGTTVSTCRRDLALRILYIPPAMDAADDQSDLIASRMKRPVLLTSDSTSANQRTGSINGGGAKHRTLTMEWGGFSRSAPRNISVPYADIGRCSCLVIVGPEGSCREMVVLSLANGDLSQYFHLAQVYTDGRTTERTCHIYEAEEFWSDEGTDSAKNRPYVYISSERFREMREAGTFAATFSQFDRQFGISERSIQEARDRNKILLVHSNLTGSLSLSRRLPKLQMFLLLPLTESVHRERLLSATRGPISQTTLQATLMEEEAEKFAREQKKPNEITNSDDDNPSPYLNVQGSYDSSTPSTISHVSSCTNEDKISDGLSSDHLETLSEEMLRRARHDSTLRHRMENHIEMLDSQLTTQYITPSSLSTDLGAARNNISEGFNLSDDNSCSGREGWGSFPLENGCSAWIQDEFTNVASRHLISSISNLQLVGGLSDCDSSAQNSLYDDKAGWREYFAGADAVSSSSSSEDTLVSHAHTTDKMYNESQVVNIIAKRCIYLQYHYDNPGLFRGTVNMDNPPLGVQQLHSQLKLALQLDGGGHTAAKSTEQQLQLTAEEMQLSPVIARLRQSLAHLVDMDYDV